MDDTHQVLGKASFSCPHCQAMAHQDWYHLHAIRFDPESKPSIPSESLLERITNDQDISNEQKEKLIEYFSRILSGKVFFDATEYQGSTLGVNNLWLSKCYSCKEVAVWVHDRLMFPRSKRIFSPNEDLPEYIKRDFNEAQQILEFSPRGSSALLRLCVQKLCKYLGKSGSNVNSDIAVLVKDGLDSRIQKSLDIVRVVGNNAVHPGALDITDDTKTASTLFGLVNLIAAAMISQRKHVDQLYESLVPDSAKEQIAKRDTVTK